MILQTVYDLCFDGLQREEELTDWCSTIQKNKQKTSDTYSHTIEYRETQNIIETSLLLIAWSN